MLCIPRALCKASGACLAVILLVLAAACGGSGGAGGGAATPDPAAPFSGMAIQSVRLEPELEVVTTGARYRLAGRTLDCWRRIDPRTNAVAERLVARLEFEAPLGAPVLADRNADSVQVDTPAAILTFTGDSLVVLEARRPLAYTHLNLIAGAPWAKAGATAVDRMWTDGEGGSLHGLYRGAPRGEARSADLTRLVLAPGDAMAHMVFPPRLFDFERMYGAQARPFVQGCFSEDQFQEILDGSGEYRANGFGVINLSNRLYRKACVPGMVPPCNPGEQDFPYPLEPALSPWVPRSGAAGYDFAQPERVKALIARAHALGFKVITYVSAEAFDPRQGPEGYRRIDHQPVARTLEVLAAFRTAYGLDGWYLDNACIQTGSLEPQVAFIRALRRMVGNEGILFHHDSVDVWDGWLGYHGLRAVMVDAYVDYTAAGETGAIAEVAGPDDPYLRFYTSGYGLSQAFGLHIRKTDGRAAISQAEKGRVLAQDLRGLEWHLWDDWRENFKPFYDLEQAKYLQGAFSPMVYWPLDPGHGWFRAPAGVLVQALGPTTAAVSWRTDAPADSRVAFTRNGAWWPSDDPGAEGGPDGEAVDPALVLQHRLVLTGLRPGTAYKLRIRSSNGCPGAGNVVWGALETLGP